MDPVHQAIIALFIGLMFNLVLTCAALIAAITHWKYAPTIAFMLIGNAIVLGMRLYEFIKVTQ